MGTNQHVVPYDGKWAVKSAGNNEPTSVHDKQADAIKVGRENAILEESELFIHGRNGKIRERNSYGNDPRGSKG